jgi:Zn-dependent metalloprotease
MQTKYTAKTMKTKSLANEAQFHLRLTSDLYKKIIKANSTDRLKSGITKSTNTTVVELIEKGLAK